MGGKPTRSCLHDTTMMHALLVLQIDELYIMGINTDQCVFMTAVEAWRTHAVTKVFVIADATTSLFGEEGYRLGLSMMQRVSNTTLINSSHLPATDGSLTGEFN